MEPKKLKKISFGQARKLLSDARREVINHTNGDKEPSWFDGHSRKIAFGVQTKDWTQVFLFQTASHDTTLFGGKKAKELFRLGRSVSKKKE
jgi:hypothetical protein